MINYFFQILPIALAFISVFACASRFAKDRRRHDRFAMILAIVCSLLLIIAQTSWWVSYAIQGNLLGTEFSNVVWTIFNSLIMICLIILAQPWRTT